MSAKKILLLVVVLASLIVFFLGGLQDYFNLAFFQDQRDSIMA